MVAPLLLKRDLLIQARSHPGGLDRFTGLPVVAPILDEKGPCDLTHHGYRHTAVALLTSQWARRLEIERDVIGTSNVAAEIQPM